MLTLLRNHWRLLLAAAAVLTACLAAVAMSATAPHRLTLLFTGDDWGELAPCG